MNVLFLTNSIVSTTLIGWLSERENVTKLERPVTIDDILAIRPDLVISYSYRHIIKAAVLDALPDKFINLHISLLPFNRGADPNTWSFLDDTPKGVSIHLIDQGIDTGPILYQREVVFDEEKDTLNSTYAALQHEIQNLFITHWDAIKNARIMPVPQTLPGTYHCSKDLAKLKDALINEDGWDVTIRQLKKRYQSLSERS